jgi:hypothetical protein
MAAETWMTAAEAVAKRYADKVADGRSKEPSAFAYGMYQNAPAQMAAIAKTVRSSAGFAEALERQAAETKAATDKAVADFLRERILGRKDPVAVALALAASLKVQAPEAYAIATQPAAWDRVIAKINASFQ